MHYERIFSNGFIGVSVLNKQGVNNGNVNKLDHRFNEGSANERRMEYCITYELLQTAS